MKSQKTLWILSVSFILAVFVYIGIQHRKIDRLNDENQLQAVELSTLKNEVDTFRTKNGDLVSKIKSIEVDKNNLKQSLETAGFDIKKLKERDIQWRKVTSALRAQLAATGSGETSVTDTFRIEKTDTLYFSKVNDWTNNYLSLFNSKIENSKLTFDYTYKTGVEILQTRSRSATIVSVALTDPKAAIVTANSITVKHEKKWHEKRWVWAVVGLTAGVLILK